MASASRKTSVELQAKAFPADVSPATSKVPSGALGALPASLLEWLVRQTAPGELVRMAP